VPATALGREVAALVSHYVGVADARPQAGGFLLGGGEPLLGLRALRLARGMSENVTHEPGRSLLLKHV